jgi:hypothetical protein
MKIDRLFVCIMYLSIAFTLKQISFFKANIKRNINHFEKYLQKTNDKIAISLIRMLRLGPDVSFSGSPTVSPITAAL